MDPFLGENGRYLIPLGEVASSCCDSGQDGGGRGHWRMKKREEGVSQGRLQWGPHPPGGEPRTVCPHIPAAAEKPGVFWGLSCQSFLKQLCSEAYAGLTSEGNFLFGEVEAKEFPVWADRAS